MEILQILSMLPSLYQTIKDALVKKGESEAAKKLDEYRGEILQKLEKVVKVAEESKKKFDQHINIVTKGDVTIQQNYYESPEYHIALGRYAEDTAAASGSFLAGEPRAAINFPDPKRYFEMISDRVGRVAEALEMQIEATRKPRVKIEPRDRWTNGGCRILVDNRGEEPITLKKIVFKWEYVSQEGDWHDFSKDYNKKFFKGDRDIIKFDVQDTSSKKKRRTK